MTFKEIIPNLWIGDSLNITSNIQKIFNLNNFINYDKDLKNLNKSDNYNIEIRQRLLKYEILKISEYFRECIKYINKNINNNQSTIVYSKNMNNCICLVIVYLIEIGRIDLKKSEKIIESKIDFTINLNHRHNLLLKKFIF